MDAEALPSFEAADEVSPFNFTDEELLAAVGVDVLPDEFFLNLTTPDAAASGGAPLTVPPQPEVSVPGLDSFQATAPVPLPLDLELPAPGPRGPPITFREEPTNGLETHDIALPDAPPVASVVTATTRPAGLLQYPGTLTHAHRGDQAPSDALVVRPVSGALLDWASMKAKIENLYLDNNFPLPEVMKLMESRHGFHAT